uniref:CYTH domain-containing protein n=1 Tax=Ascaris lumbricoides TaxID=6252 RepID=A0A0M3HSJ4_ASCLU
MESYTLSEDTKVAKLQALGADIRRDREAPFGKRYCVAARSHAHTTFHGPEATTVRRAGKVAAGRRERWQATVPGEKLDPQPHARRKDEHIDLHIF